MKGRGTNTNNKGKKSANLVISNNFALLDQVEEDVNKMVDVPQRSSSKKVENTPPSSKKRSKQQQQVEAVSSSIPSIENISNVEDVTASEETVRSELLTSTSSRETVESDEVIDESTYKPLTLKKLYIHQNTWKGII
jgi:hypothetical protein